MSERLASALAELVDALRDELASVTTRPADVERLLSVEEAARVLGIGRTAMYGEIAALRCRSVKVGRRRLVPASALAAYSAPEPEVPHTGRRPGAMVRAR